MRKLLLIAFLAACGGKQPSSATTTPTAATAGGGSAASLFASLGGEPAVRAVVKDFVEQEVATDARVNVFFRNTNIPNLEEKLYEQICNVTGGGCQYTGKDMKTAHAGMGVTEADFTAVVDDLVKSLDKFKVKDADKQQILKVLGGTKGDIVTK